MSARAEYIAGLRGLANLLEARPEIELPYEGVAGLSASVFINTIDGPDPLAQAIAYAAAMDGRPTVKVTDHPGHPNFWVEVEGRIRGFHLLVHVRVHDVCQMVDGKPVVPAALLKLAKLVEQVPAVSHG